MSKRFKDNDMVVAWYRKQPYVGYTVGNTYYDCISHRRVQGVKFPSFNGQRGMHVVTIPIKNIEHCSSIKL